jgi:hypothetical protein
VVDPYLFDELAHGDPDPGGVHVLPAPGGAPAVDTWKLGELKDRVRAWAARDGRRKRLRAAVPLSAAALTQGSDTFTFMAGPSRWFEPDSGLPVTVETHRTGVRRRERGLVPRPLGQVEPPSGCRGTLAIGGFYRSSERRTINGQSFYRIIDADVTTADGWQGCGF